MAGSSSVLEPELINLTDSPDSLSTLIRSTLYQRGMCCELIECADRLEFSMKSINRRQEENEKYLMSLKSNLNELKLTLTPFLKSDSSEEKTTSANSSFLQSARLHQNFIFGLAQKGAPDNREHANGLDWETSSQLISLFLNEIEADSAKLDENINGVQVSQITNIKHLESIKKIVLEAEKHLKNVELETVQSAECASESHASKLNCSFKEAAVQTEEIDNQNKRRCGENPDDVTRVKKRRTDEKGRESEHVEGRETAGPSRDYPESHGPLGGPFSNIPSSQDYREKQCSQEKKQDLEENIIDAEERSEPPNEIEDLLYDAEKIVLEMRKKLNTFEDNMMESRKMLNSLYSNLNSIWLISKEQQRRKQVEQAAAEFNVKVQQEMCFPSCSSQSQQTPRSSFRFTASKSYFDTRSENARTAIQNTDGPLKPDQLTAFLDEVKGKKQNIISLAMQFTENIRGLLEQLISVKNYLDESYRQFMRIPGNVSASFDQRLQKRLGTLIQNIESCLQEIIELRN